MIKKLLMLSAFAAGFAGMAEPFRDGERVVFWGDSITHGGQYGRMLADFYLTRYPDRTMRFYNSGVGGDNAGAAMTRFEEDVSRWNPSVVTVMFGMNDSWRDMYRPDRMADTKHRAGVPAREKQCYEHYVANMKRLVARVRKDLPQTRLMFLTPTPTDETAVQKSANPTPALKGSVEALRRFSDFMKTRAAETGSEVVDWHTLFHALTLREQKGNPEFTLLRPDRVHPMAPGHLYMTYEFLKAQGATNVVCDVAVSAKDGAALKSENGVVSAFEKTADGCAFTLFEKALPWPISKDAESMLSLVNITDELNREMIAVRDLAPGARYAVFIDGGKVGEWTAEELARGVNLARNEKTPQYRQAMEVARKNAERWGIESNQLRMFACSRWYLRLRKVNPDDMAAVQAHYDGLANKNGYFERRLPEYIREYAKKPALEADQDARWAELLKMRMPKAHRYEVKRMAAKGLAGREEFRIRDPFVLAENGTYYLYESKPWFGGKGVGVRTSVDLKKWSDVEPAMTLPAEVKNTAVWAPEVHKYNGAYWLFTTLTFEPDSANPIKPMVQEGFKGAHLQPRGTWVFKSESAKGPFKPVRNGPVTPKEWMCLDGTLWVEDGKPWMVFCHEWCQVGNGRMMAAPLNDDFTGFTSEPIELFRAADVKDGGFVTDGPFLFKSSDGALRMIWSNALKGSGYCVIQCRSESGKIAGPWKDHTPLYRNDGGHGMIFKTFDGRQFMTFHQPNSSPNERMKLFPVANTPSGLAIKP